MLVCSWTGAGDAPGSGVQELGVEVSGLPLAVAREGTYVECSFEIPPGGFVMVYTDGVTEALHADQGVYGQERLYKQVEAAAGDPCQVGQLVIDDVRRFIGASPQSDDMCLVCFGRT